ncbi:GNAT family N-acetyltransferase [Photobacterium sp. OFAV2-7]|uniref:GNAT family N-acetyltransferase n=1 Tax=Photobacterium sp. OFAV2-7 TaxID=2917748 RepID=UPI001EF670A7|nr:GNAT family protein [Photobacterium sp. OFAV2-7]MCG7584861.1 GNAT family N-acetyltransferase [Photobacterium sp. OFAV2-7]
MILETSRLQIRNFGSADYQSVLEYMTDEVTTHFLGEGRLSANQVIDFLASNSGASPKAYPIIEKSSQVLIGHIEFYPWFGDHTYEIGWVINPKFQGQGYGYEAAKAILEHGFTQLHIHRVIATCQPENPASYRLMEKLGMVREGYFRQCIPKGNDVWWDEYFYSILKSDYDNLGK